MSVKEDGGHFVGRRTARETALVRPGPAPVQGVNERMKTVFTTGEAAKICKVSQQTIIRCFDNGQLKGFRVPGSRFLQSRNCRPR